MDTYMEYEELRPQTLTIEEAARRLGIGRTLAYELARRNQLPVPVLRLGRRMVVSRIALTRALAGSEGYAGLPDSASTDDKGKTCEHQS